MRVYNVYDDAFVLAQLVIIIAALVVIDNEIADLDADIVLLQADVDAIAVLVEAEAILEETGGTITTDGTEQNVYINNAPAGVYKPLWFNINLTPMTVAETVVIRTYHRNVAGGAWVQDDAEPFYIWEVFYEV